GGGSSVWTTCLLFFQVGLLLAYGYAHWLAGRGLGRLSVGIHAALLLAAGAAAVRWAGGETVVEVSGWGGPRGAALSALATTVGLPYFALATTAPLVQAWYAAVAPGLTPYRLYSFSNAGSLAGLLT